MATYAIVRTGSKQYRVQAGDSIRVESLPAYAGEIVDIDDVLMVSADGDVRVGAPVVSGARVRAQVTSRGRGRKIRVFKYKPKVRYRRMKGHRQPYTDLRIIDISIDGEPLDAVVEPDEPTDAAQEAAPLGEAGSGETSGDEPEEAAPLGEAGSGEMNEDAAEEVDGGDNDRVKEENSGA